MMQIEHNLAHHHLIPEERDEGIYTESIQPRLEGIYRPRVPHHQEGS
jgi:hypothetical protein